MAIHIGKKIHERAKTLEMPAPKLARKLCMTKQNIYGIFKRETIDTGLLQKIGKALDYNFFTYYMPPQREYAGLKKELENISKKILAASKE